MESSKQAYFAASKLLTEQVKVILVGCGGTGAHVLTIMGNMDFSLKAMGHPGFHVEVFDFDKVEPFNVGRQPFYPADVGHHKGKVLVNRINALYGTGWRFHPERFPGKTMVRDVDLVVGCVDTRKSRREIHSYLQSRWGSTLWLDMGNKATTGQVVLGEFSHKAVAGVLEDGRLPVVTELFPDILNASIPDDPDVPSCSMREALTKQALLINREVANQGMAILWDLLTTGSIRRHGCFIDLGEGRSTPMPVDKKFWSRMGIAVAENEPLAA